MKLTLNRRQSAARSGKRRPIRGAVAAGASILTIVGATLVVGPSVGTASAGELNCDGNAYVSLVQVQDFTDGQFEIKVTPTSNTRNAWFGGYELEATYEIWHAVQNCVPGLYGHLADGIYQQIECHVIGAGAAPLKLGGPTYDFESWRGTTDPSTEIASQCNWGGWPYQPLGQPPYRPDRPFNNPTF